LKGYSNPIFPHEIAKSPRLLAGVKHVGELKMKLSIHSKTRDITLNTILDMEIRIYQLFLPC